MISDGSRDDPIEVTLASNTNTNSGDPTVATGRSIRIAHIGSQEKACRKAEDVTSRIVL